MRTSLSYRRLAPPIVALVALALALALSAPAEAFAGRLKDIGTNVRQELGGAIGQLFLLAIGALGFMAFMKRRFGEMLILFLAGTVVAWMIFAPTQVGDTLGDVYRDVFGGRR